MRNRCIHAPLDRASRCRAPRKAACCAGAGVTADRWSIEESCTVTAAEFKDGVARVTIEGGHGSEAACCLLPVAISFDGQRHGTKIPVNRFLPDQDALPVGHVAWFVEITKPQDVAPTKVEAPLQSPYVAHREDVKSKLEKPPQDSRRSALWIDRRAAVVQQSRILPAAVHRRGERIAARTTRTFGVAERRPRAE